jgi:hypothetical protein
MVYHVGTFGNWDSVVDEQMLTIQTSGLYDKLDSILVGAHGPDCTAKVTAKFESYSKVSIKVTEELDLTYENKTINLISELAQEYPNCYIIYIHTKGVTLKNKIQTPWRHYMMDHVVKSHELCIDLLNRGYETVGSLLLLNEFFFGFPHYSGNFFWTTTNYVANNLDLITNLQRRHEAEIWLLKKMKKNCHIGLGPVWFNFQYSFMSSKNLYYKHIGQTDFAYVI